MKANAKAAGASSPEEVQVATQMKKDAEAKKEQAAAAKVKFPKN